MLFLVGIIVQLVCTFFQPIQTHLLAHNILVMIGITAQGKDVLNCHQSSIEKLGSFPFISNRIHLRFSLMS